MIKINFTKERELRINSLNNSEQTFIKSFNQDLKHSEVHGKDLILKALNFAKNIEYNHTSLSKESYLVHPIRVASMSLKFIDNLTQDAVILALLHNIFEVSKVSKEIVEQKFGALINNSISILTVNRELQWNKEYKEQYYSKIKSFSTPAMEIKVLDKFDNIFVIGLNPNKQIRIKYIKEIQEYIIPMAEMVLPELSETLEYACFRAEKNGHTPK